MQRKTAKRKEIIMAMVATIPPQAAQMTINLSDIAIAGDVRRLLKRVQGVQRIVVRKTSSELDLAMAEAEAGKYTRWNSVNDYFKQFEAK